MFVYVFKYHKNIKTIHNGRIQRCHRKTLKKRKNGPSAEAGIHDYRDTCIDHLLELGRKDWVVPRPVLGYRLLGGWAPRYRK